MNYNRNLPAEIICASLDTLFEWIEQGALDIKNPTTAEKYFLTERLEGEIRYRKKRIENIQLFLTLAKNPDELLYDFHHPDGLERLAEKTGLTTKQVFSALKDFKLRDLTAEGISKIEIKLNMLCSVKEKLIGILEEVRNSQAKTE